MQLEAGVIQQRIVLILCALARFSKQVQHHDVERLGPTGPRVTGINASTNKSLASAGADLRTALSMAPGQSSSIFLAHEFEVEVWAVDLWFSASETQQRIRDAGVERSVYPIRADARSLPFANDFFDAIISIDSFPYYGTDDLYLGHLTRFVKPGGQIAISGAGLMREIVGAVPE